MPRAPGGGSSLYCAPEVGNYLQTEIRRCGVGCCWQLCGTSSDMRVFWGLINGIVIIFQAIAVGGFPGPKRMGHPQGLGSDGGIVATRQILLAKAAKARIITPNNP